MIAPTRTQTRILTLLSGVAPLTPKQVGRAFGWDGNNARQHLSVMHRLGLVARVSATPLQRGTANGGGSAYVAVVR